MHSTGTNAPRLNHWLRRLACALLLAGIATPAFGQDAEQLRGEVARLEAQLAAARQALANAEQQRDEALERAASLDAAADGDDAPAEKIVLGPFSIGGAIRANYVLGDYDRPDGAPSRGGDGGDFELDTFRINVDFAYEDFIGKLEYRWYNGYNFLHTGWVGYNLPDDGGQIQVGVNRVPFGPGPYGVSYSWFFDQHYYVGLSDDMDFGIKYTKTFGNLKLDLAYYLTSEGQWKGSSKASARYSYDPVLWNAAANDDGSVDFAAEANGYQEEHQFNVRAVYTVPDAPVATDIGGSLQYGMLDGTNVEDDDGSHVAASVHMKNSVDNFTVVSQLTYYSYDIDGANPWGTTDLIPMGAYDFAWPVATEAWIPAISARYSITTDHLDWLDSVTPYVEYSSIMKDADGFNDSEMFTLGAAWWRGGWYIYTDLVFSNGNYFVGDEGDNYGSFAGVGDFGINGNDEWNHRFNINFGYYF